MNNSLSAAVGFIALPSDPKLLTVEHARACFGGDVDGVLRDLVRHCQLNHNAIQTTLQPTKEIHHAALR